MLHVRACTDILPRARFSCLLRVAEFRFTNYVLRKHAKSSSQVMATLPKEKVLSGVCPFCISGCDFFGLYLVLDNRKTLKR